jgi:hypothetical protein
MNTTKPFPSFDDWFPELNQFLLELVQTYEAGKINSWDDLDEKVKAYFTPQRMEQMESLVPGWQKMASYAEGVTLVHVMCVFLGLFMLPEFQSLTLAQKQIAKWIVLFHDVEKEIHKGKRDPIHGFRSAVITAKHLPDFGFPITSEYGDLIASWSQLTSSAIESAAGSSEPVQDNDKLPRILAEAERMFGADTPAALIVKGVLLHMSVTVVPDWPQAAPLTEAEIKKYVSRDLAPLLKVMMLADNEGWSLFDSEARAKQRIDTLKTFEKLEQMISN